MFLSIFLSFSRINSRLPYNFSKLSSEKKNMEFQKKFSIIFAKYYFKIFQELSFSFFGNVTINAKFFRVFKKFVYCSHFRALFKRFLKTVSKFLQFFFKTSINFCANSPQFSLQVFQNFFLELIRTYPVISTKLLQKSLKCSRNFRKISISFINYFKISR